MASSTAVESLAEHLNYNPGSLVFPRLADLYRKSGDMSQAIDVCTRGLERHPDCITGRIVLGRCYLDRKDLENAISVLITVCRMDRRNLAAIKMLADIFMRQGLAEKAGDLFSLLVKMDPRNALLANVSSRYKGSGNNNLFAILELTPAPATAESKPFDRTIFLEDLPAAAAGSDRKSLPETPATPPMSAFSLDTVHTVADAGAAVEEMLTEATTITGSDISDRMSALFGEKPSAAKAKTPPKPTPPPGETVTSFTVEPPARGRAVFPDGKMWRQKKR